MTFETPLWLWALALIPVLVFLFIGNERRGRELLGKIVALRLLDRLAGSISPGRRRLRFAVLLLGITLVIVSMARPRYGYTWEQSKRRGREVLIAIDVSKSMLSNDVAPNRLTRAKLAAQDLVNSLQGDRAGVLAFAGSSFLQAPLTIDYGAVLDSINDLDTNTIPLGGTNIAAVIGQAAKAFGKGESENRCLILFTDGEELDADGVAAARREADNFRIFTVGVGTTEGAIIPVSEGDSGTTFVKDSDGQIVKSRLDEKRLREIAEATGGFYTHLEHGPADMKRIVEEGLGKIQERDIDGRMSRRPIERYQWPLGAGLFFIAASLLISEKRRARAQGRMKPVKAAPAAAAALLLFVVAVSSAHSAPLNKGVQLYNDQKYKDSYDTFSNQLKRDPNSQALEFDSGAAAYKSGDFDKAIEAFGKATTSAHPGIREQSEYNLGNALCLRGVKQESKDSKLKDWTNSIQHYDEALKIDPKNEDAKFNRDVVQKLIDELKKEQQQSKQDQQKKDDQKKDQKDKQDQKDQQNQQNQKDKKDQKDQQQKKDQQQQGGQGENKDQQQQQQNGQQQNKDHQQNGQGQDKNQQQQQQNGQGSKDQKQHDQQSKNGDEKKDQSKSADQGKNQDQQGKQNPSPDNGNNSTGQQQASQQPTPGQDEPGKKYSGQIKDAQQGQQGEQGQTGEQEKAYVPGQEREMTAAEAKRIVESEKDEEAKGVLIERKASAPVLKDW